MTEKECAMLMRMNLAYYKNSAKPLTDAELANNTQIWFYHLHDYPFETVKKALLDAMTETEFPVQLKHIFDKLKPPRVSAETEWQSMLEAVNKAQRYIGWRACPMIVGQDDAGKPIRSHGEAELTEVYNSLPESGKAYLGGVSGLVDLARLGDTDLQFRRNEFLRVAREQPATPAMLPGAAKAQIGGGHE
jgi:hypothetical protein